jgi:hypothetical protein
MARPLTRLANVLTIGTNLGMLAADYINPKPTPKPTPRKSPIKSKMKGGSKRRRSAVRRCRKTRRLRH